MSHELETYLAIAPRSPEQQVLRLLIELGIQVVEASEGSLLVLDPASQELVFAMTCGSSESERSLQGQRVPLGRGLTGLAAATREVQIGAPTFRDVKQSIERRGSEPEAVIAAPMLVNDELVGVITAVSYAPGKRFVGRDAELYARIAAVAGLVVQQRQQLDAARALSSGQSESAPGAGRERSIAEAVARIARLRPGALAHLASVLSGIEGLIGSTEEEHRS